MLIILLGFSIAGAWLKTNDSCAGAQSATRFRGDNGQGVYNVANLPAKWTDKNIKWRTTLPGIGHSSPVVWGEKIFVTSADGDENQGRLFALNINNGAILWRQNFQFAAFNLDYS